MIKIDFSTNAASHSMNFNLAIKIKPNMFLHEAYLMIILRIQY